MSSLLLMSAILVTTFLITKAKASALKKHHAGNITPHDVAKNSSGTMYASFTASTIFFLGIFMGEIIVVIGGLAGYWLVHKLYFTDHALMHD